MIGVRRGEGVAGARRCRPAREMLSDGLERAAASRAFFYSIRLFSTQSCHIICGGHWALLFLIDPISL